MLIFTKVLQIILKRIEQNGLKQDRTCQNGTLAKIGGFFGCFFSAFCYLADANHYLNQYIPVSKVSVSYVWNLNL